MRKSNRTAYEAALHLLGYRSQSEQEVRVKLKRKGYTSGEIDTAIHRLYEYHYLDDAMLAEEIFCQYQKNLLYGDRYIQQKLQSRGLSISLHLTREEELEKAEKALRLRLQSIPDFLENYRRASGYLLRRGFSPSVIMTVLDQVNSVSD